jgi:prolyl-tRNA synthetase
MGCYGIGVPRTLAAIIEASHDENGIVWPVGVAPFDVVIVVANIKDQAALAAAQQLHDTLTARGVDVMLDERDERAGVKFKDADLIGYPVRVVAGKGVAANGVVELRARRDPSSAREVPVAEAAEAIITLLAELRDTALGGLSNRAIAASTIEPNAAAPADVAAVAEAAATAARQ